MPIIRQCRVCDSDFKTKPFFINNGGGKYCSVKCSSQSRKNGKIIKCFICKKEAYKTLKALNKSQSKKYFCSKICSIYWQNTVFIGTKHPNWKNGWHSYRHMLKQQKISQKCVLCGEKNLQVLAVHHIDKDRKNNKLSNLAWLCHNCHFLVHHYSKEKELFDLLINK